MQSKDTEGRVGHDFTGTARCRNCGIGYNSILCEPCNNEPGYAKPTEATLAAEEGTAKPWITDANRHLQSERDVPKLPYSYLPEIRSAIGGTVVCDEPMVTVADLIDEVLRWHPQDGKVLPKPDDTERERALAVLAVSMAALPPKDAEPVEWLIGTGHAQNALADLDRMTNDSAKRFEAWGDSLVDSVAWHQKRANEYYERAVAAESKLVGKTNPEDRSRQFRLLSELVWAVAGARYHGRYDEAVKLLNDYLYGNATVQSESDRVRVPEQVYRRLLCPSCEGGKKFDPIRCMKCQGHHFIYEPVEPTVQAEGPKYKYADEHEAAMSLNYAEDNSSTTAPEYFDIGFKKARELL